MDTRQFLYRAYDYIKTNGYEKGVTGKYILDNFDNLSKASNKQIDEYIDWWTKQFEEKRSDYNAAVWAANMAKELKDRNLNILCSGLSVYFKEMKRQAERDSSTSTYVGKEKEKVFVKIKEIRKLFENQFGYSIFRVVGEDDNVYVISTTIYNLKPGDEIKGTIKGYKDYKGEKQTLLNRISKTYENADDGINESLIDVFID